MCPLCKTLKCADPNLTLPHEAILGKRHTASLIGGGRERRDGGVSSGRFPSEQCIFMVSYYTGVVDFSLAVLETSHLLPKLAVHYSPPQEVVFH